MWWKATLIVDIHTGNYAIELLTEKRALAWLEGLRLM